MYIPKILRYLPLPVYFSFFPLHLTGMGIFLSYQYDLYSFWNYLSLLQDQFKGSYESILKERESEAKLVRAREAREKNERVGAAVHCSFVYA